MEENINVLIVNGDYETTIMFEGRGFSVSCIDTDVGFSKNLLDNIHLVVLAGGTDISSCIYGEKIEEHTDLPDIPRDIFEIDIIQHAVFREIPIVGICRGFQLLACHLGGFMLQHDTSKLHQWSHDITLKDGSILKDYPANHHQIVLPPKSMEIVGTYGTVVEIAAQVSLGILGFQGHPEWCVENSTNQNAFFELLNKYCL